MDETTYRISRKKLMVNFDLRDQENCFINLTFTKDDILNILNMDVLKKLKIEVRGIEGTASLSAIDTVDRNICFGYRNGSKTDTGTVFYPYDKMVILLSEAFKKIS